MQKKVRIGCRFFTAFFAATALALGCDQRVLNTALQQLDFEISKENVIIRAGTSFGNCIGYCKTEMVLQGTGLTFKQLGWDFAGRNLPDRFYTDSIAVEQWNTLINNLDWQAFSALDSVIGCPDCADGGAEWLDITYFGQRHKVTFEFGSEISAIREFLSGVRAIRQDILDRIENAGVLPRAIISQRDPDSLQADAFTLNSANVRADTLTLDVTYAGGCRTHFFTLYMTPDTFQESFPPQADLYLIHNSNGDFCEAAIRMTKKFDLSPIGELYRATYGHDDDIVLNIYSHYTENRGEPVRVTYRTGN